MAEAIVIDALETSEALAAEGARVARLIWNDDPAVSSITDPRVQAFANAVIDGLAADLATTPGALHRLMTGAAAAAEDLNVEPFHGLIEILQNADDLGATEVRFALREMLGRRQLLVVHDGAPVVCQHVLAMTLPYLTTKRDDPSQKGRFGIGLKTLARIATALSVHSRPYHFRAQQLSLSRIEPEPAIDHFYQPSSDTLIILDLTTDCQENELEQWFVAWGDDGLLFLNAVCSFRWCDLEGRTVSHKRVLPTAWESFSFEPTHEETLAVRRRLIRGDTTTWTAFSADVRVPPHLERAHKATSDLTTVSIAVPDQAEQETGIFIAFKTRIPTELAICMDAQFDPSTGREEIIDNAWNAWLIERIADLIGDVACGLIASDPKTAWRIVPLSNEEVGTTAARWPRLAFGDAFQRTRKEIGARAVLRTGDGFIALNETAYEDAALTGLLEGSDVELLSEPRKALPISARDDKGRWRRVCGEIGVSQTIGTSELLSGFLRGLFRDKPPQWWVKAAERITGYHPMQGVFGIPIWLTSDGEATACHPPGKTSRPLVFVDSMSNFAARWRLLYRLHPAFGESAEGGKAREWLVKNAAFTITPGIEVELAAFAEAFTNSPISVGDEDLREIRGHFDALTDRRAEELGRRVGAAILLDGFTFRSGRRRSTKVSPTEAYLSRSLDVDHPYWPEAADALPGVVWLSGSYDEKLRTGATRGTRKRADGTISRGPRRFLMLLGAECAPRLAELGRQYGGGPTRRKQLQERGAELVDRDYVSPDMERVLDALPRMSMKQRRARSAALLKTFSRHWNRVYANKATVPALHAARRYTYSMGEVTAAWLCKLREVEWVAVGKGNLVAPTRAVVKSAQTESLYDGSSFVCGVEATDVEDELASRLELITDVRASDLVRHLEEIRDGNEIVEQAHLLHVYRTLAKLCSKDTFTVGDLARHAFRQRFASGKGLMSLRPVEWKRPDELFSGKDVLHRPERFVPNGPAYNDLWGALGIGPPDLTVCIDHCRHLAELDIDSTTEASLIDVYRHMEPQLARADRGQQERMRRLPLMCFGEWKSGRPIYYVEDRELRAALAHVLIDHSFWTPPCDVSTLPNLTSSFGLISLNPSLTVTEDHRRGLDAGEDMRARFRQSVDQLSNELARHDALTRDHLAMTWDELRDIPLLVYDRPFNVLVRDVSALTGAISIRMKALLSRAPIELHVWVDGLQQRDNCGRAIASLFPPETRWGVENAWVASWIASREGENVAPMRLASDETHAEQLSELAEKVEGTKRVNLQVKPPGSRTSPAKPRTLKSFHGGIAGVAVHAGAVRTSPDNKSGPIIPLVDNPPAPSQPSASGTSAPAPVHYSTADLEQRGWEILSHVLDTYDAPDLVDFRKRHGVGADGVVDWKTFVELKATGRGLQSSVEMSNSEFERAKERGLDFILALVSGLEEGQRTEVRLILDPANRATVRPIHGVRLVGLADAPAVVVSFDDDAKDHATGDVANDHATAEEIPAP